MRDKNKEGYIIYECLTCHKTTILLARQVDHSHENGRYVTCGYDGRHRNMKPRKKYDSIKECMEHDSFKRVSGRVRRNG